MRILLDMDEVLCDFVGGACEIHGTTREELNTKRTPGVWSIVEPLGLTMDEFWQPIHEAGSAFWMFLKETPWFDKLILSTNLLCNEYGLEFAIVTTPSSHATSVSGKMRWLRSRLGNDVPLVFTNRKELLACKEAILIDDSERNLQKFSMNGGHSIIFPNFGNRLHHLQDDPLEHVFDRLKSVLRS